MSLYPDYPSISSKQMQKCFCKIKYGFLKLIVNTHNYGDSCMLKIILSSKPLKSKNKINMVVSFFIFTKLLKLFKNRWQKLLLRYYRQKG